MNSLTRKGKKSKLVFTFFLLAMNLGVSIHSNISRTISRCSLNILWIYLVLHFYKLRLVFEDRALNKLRQHIIEGGWSGALELIHDFQSIVLLLCGADIVGDTGIVHRPILWIPKSIIFNILNLSRIEQLIYILIFENSLINQSSII